jgi:hypothetical protein
MSIQCANKAINPSQTPTELLDAQYHEVLQAVTGAEDLKQEAMTLGTQARSAKQMAAVDAYLFWRKAHQVSGYLEGLYAARGIAHNNLKRNGVNFNPVVNLLYGHLRKDAGWIANMAKSLNAIDNEYVRDPAIYRADPADRLYNWVASNGGLSGIRNKISDLDTESNQEALSPQIKERAAHLKAKYRAPTREVHRAILQKHTDQLVSSTGTVLPISDVAFSNDNSAMTDLVVLLARREPNGLITQIGSTNERGLVEAAVSQCVRFDHGGLSPILATLVECILPHCVPRTIVTKGNRTKFFSKHAVQIDDAGKMEKRPERARLVVRTDGSLLISKVHAQSGLTTISKPKAVDLASDETLVLRGIDRYHLEHNLLLDSQIALVSSEPSDQLGAVDVDKVAHLRSLPLKTLSLKSEKLKERAIYFHSFAEFAAAQPIIKDPENVVYDWELEASKTYFHRFFARGFSPWLGNVKNGLGASGNTAVNLVLFSDRIELQSKWLREKKDWDRTAAVDPGCMTPFGADASIKFVGGEKATASIVVHPHDLLELMSCLSTASLIGRVRVQGNDSLLYLSWETPLATHQAWIPSSNTQGHRAAKHFEAFNCE